MKSIKLLAATLLIGSVAGPFTTTPALAGDGKAYPGNMCVPWADNRYPTYMAGAIGNPHDKDWLYVDCPLVKDSIGDEVEDGWVRMIDRHYDKDHDVFCTLVVTQYGYQWSGDGWHGKRFGPLRSEGSSTHVQHKYMKVEKDVSEYHTTGNRKYAFYSCAIPPKHQGNVSYITSYYMEEND